jgi:hypothetical protein
LRAHYSEGLAAYRRASGMKPQTRRESFIGVLSRSPLLPHAQMDAGRARVEAEEDEARAKSGQTEKPPRGASFDRPKPAPCPVTLTSSRSGTEQDRHSARSGTRANQSAIQARQRQVRDARPDQGLKVKRARVLALAPGLHAFALTPRAASGGAPPCRQCVSEGFHEHENIREHRRRLARTLLSYQN